MKILHILAYGLPRRNGYTLRSHNIFLAQKKFGVESIACTLNIENKEVLPDSHYENLILYYHNHYSSKDYTNIPSKILSLIRKLLQFSPVSTRYNELLINTYLSAQYIVGIAKKERIDILHAHSPFYCGLAAQLASQILQIPYVYEVRGLWHFSGVAEQQYSEHDFVYRFYNICESYVIRQCPQIFVIGKSLQNEITSWGIDDKKFTIVSNAIAPEKFIPQPKNKTLVSKLNINNDTPVFGYIGSIRKLEGLDIIIEAFPFILQRLPNAKLLLVGGGDYIQDILEKSKRLQIESSVIYTGSVPQNDVAHYYSLIDIFFVTRSPKEKVNQIVTPLKPLEAMAMEKCLIVSDLPALKEFVTDNETGTILYNYNPSDLADLSIDLYQNKTLMKVISKNARKFVIKNFTWENSVSKYIPIYHSLVTNKDRE